MITAILLPDAASLNEDYSYVYEVISISEEEEVCTQVPILDDILYEGFESFEVLMYPLNGSRLDYAYTITRVFIEEDDNGRLYNYKSYVSNGRIPCRNFLKTLM